MRRNLALCAMVSCALFAAACGSDDSPDENAAEQPAATETAQADKAVTTGEQSEFFVQADYDKQLAQRDIEPEGPADKPWEQMLEPEMVDTSEFKAKKASGWNLCFSNAAVDNPWRQVGWKTMQQEVKLHDEIANFKAVDAEAKDDKQISDIEELAGGNCDALIVSPNTTATLTPAVEAACEKVPVIVFDRGVNTDCPVTFVHPIGGYAFGADGAEFLIDNVDAGGKILALRILPGVDVLETRWSAAKVKFDESDLDVVGVEFTDGDAAKTKSIVSDYLQREGELAGVWMDAGATAVAAMEAFEDNGQEIPPFVGEDQNDFLTKWQEDGLTAIAPTYSNYQWRTAVIAATKILKGEEVPKEWVLPQPAITADTLGDYVDPKMPPLHYALCGCEDMPGYPETWGGKK
ncbi:MAG TPA: substrate-binding domain-containing protein [Solirubrobacteraceae bacterium]|nr:substrate-binding domain-containing protein [Solirubrobacteraceae bacterium]